MPAVKGLFNYLQKFEEIGVNDLQKWLKVKEAGTILENRLGNRILYSQTIPQNPQDLSFDSAVIREIIELNQTKFYNKNLKRIDIPEIFSDRFPNLQNLTGAFIDAISPNGITAFFLISDRLGRKNLGTYIRPENLQEKGIIIIGIKDQQYQIRAGCLAVIPALESKVDITFSSSTAKLTNKKILTAEVVGGQLGIIIDARIPC